MSAWCRSGVAVCLLAVICVTAGQQSISLLNEMDKLRTELQQFDSKVVAMDSKLGDRMDALARRLQFQVDALDSRMVLLDSRVDELTVQLLKNSQKPRLDELYGKSDSQQSQLDEMVAKLDSQQLQLNGMSNKMNNQITLVEALTTRLDGQESQAAELVAKLDNQQSQLVALTDTSSSERSRLDGAANKTASQQTQIDELAVRLDQVEDLTNPKPHDCSELLPGAISGVHLIWPALDRSRPPVQAYCEMKTHGGKWTLVQRRADIQPHQNFNLGWADYKRGFGDLTGEFWWGLEFLSQLMSHQNRSYELRIDLEAINGDKAHAIYQDFRISSEAEGYRLSAASYTGDAGDSLGDGVNRKFSTRDRDQDLWSGGSCAEWRQGAWWYGIVCSFSNLNGPYVEGGAGDQTGIWWGSWKRSESLKKTVMKIRPI